MLYNMWLYSTFNIIYCSLPICFYAVFDKEIDYEDLESDNKYYNLGLRGKLFNTLVFWTWILEATIQGALICLICVFGICG
jgi:magnesium-transporting ATPase (P-type)|mmetsp:Transcript_16749/g.2742  ORF Transcript_16749/g.2742 Transcript_16749/m.2742 type:complete len:81 (+) Transcript_16749:49-291(+)